MKRLLYLIIGILFCNSLVMGQSANNDDYIYAVGSASGPLTQQMYLNKLAVEDAVKNLTKNFSAKMNSNDATLNNKIYNIIVDNVEIVNSGFAQSGRQSVECMVEIRVKIADLLDKVENVVSEDEELKIRFKESEFREQMKQSLKENSKK